MAGFHAACVVDGGSRGGGGTLVSPESHRTTDGTSHSPEKTACSSFSLMIRSLALFSGRKT